MRDLSSKSEEQIAQLRNSFEMQKQMLEERLQKEKESSKKKREAQEKEYEQRLKDEQNGFEQELEFIQENFKEKDQRQMATIHQAEQENALLEQRCDSLLKQLKDKEDALMREHSLN